MTHEPETTIESVEKLKKRIGFAMMDRSLTYIKVTLGDQSRLVRILDLEILKGEQR